MAQVADVVGGRNHPLSELQRREGVKTVPGEFSEVKHTRGILSMGRCAAFRLRGGCAPAARRLFTVSLAARYDDPNSATSSFSILLGNAPHLDGTYAVFGMMVEGDDVLQKMEEVETKREGIFVMPKDRIQIVSSYVYSAGGVGSAAGKSDARCSTSLSHCRAQVQGLQEDVHKCRREKLP